MLNNAMMHAIGLTVLFAFDLLQIKCLFFEPEDL